MGGQDFADAADVVSDMSCRVEDDIVPVDQDDVALTPHDFHNQLFQAAVAKFVLHFDLHLDDSFEILAGHAADESAADMFSQEHAEHGRGGRILRAFVGREVDACVRAAAADEQAMILSARPDL